MFVTALSTVAGVALILVGMRDMVHELFHPEESGSISTWVMERVWDGAKLVGRRFPGALSRAGPVIIFSVVGMWVLIFALGWALIYMPHIGDSSGGLGLSGTLPAQARGHFWTAFFYSLASLVTLSVAEVTPMTTWLRVLLVGEALIGFATLSAWITWVLSLYPVLSARRSYVLQIAAMQETERRTGGDVLALPADEATQLLRSLAERTLCVTTDLMQSPVSYYFHHETARTSMMPRIPYLLELARRAGGPESPPGLRYHAQMLGIAAEELVQRMASRFLGMHDVGTEEALRALARDHFRDLKNDPKGRIGEGSDGPGEG